MEIKTSYRLRSYKILEYENGLLWWETHFDFGMERSGVLRACQEEQKGRSTRKVRSQPDSVGKPDHTEIPAAVNPISPPEPLKKLPSSESTFPKSMTAFFSFFTRIKGFKVSWPWFTRKKFWLAGLIVLAVSGVILGVSIALHSLDSRFHRLYWFKERHHQDHFRSHSILLILLLILFSAGIGPARPLGAEERDMILDSGIHYPGGFDFNTVGEVQGKASHFFRPEKGPVRFQLLTNYGTYTILTCPPWYWNDLPVRIPEGAEVAVRGSKSIGRDGNLYVIAQEVQMLPSGPSFLFRVKDGTPAWKASAGPGRESWGGGGPQHRGRR
jgi:hypothetical protein